VPFLRILTAGDDTLVMHRVVRKTKEKTMKNLSFVLWMLGYPIVIAIDGYLGFLKGKTYSDHVNFWAALIVIIIWITVGKMLYEKRKDNGA